MEHFMVMIFNLKMEGRPATYEGNPSWLETRLNIFEKYCINAFASQTDPNFKLLVYCDKNTPNPYKDRLLNLQSNYNFIHICWDFSKKEDMEWNRTKLKNSILNHIKNFTSKETKEVICSRFENDDIPSVQYNEYVKEIHKTLDTISLGRGLYWDLNTDQWINSWFPTGPFISVKSSLDNFISPIEDEHPNYVIKRGGTPIDTEGPLWIQLIHGKNLWNQVDKMPGQLCNAPSLEYLKENFAYE